MKRAIQRSQERLEKLQITSAVNTHQMKDIETPVTPDIGSGEYLIQMAIGTPALSLSAIMDTGSDLVWTKCNPCTDCSTSSIYDPSSSSTYSKVLCQSSLCQPPSIFSCNNDGDCEYVYPYGDRSSTSGILSDETFSISSQSLPNITFGCGHDNQGFDKVGGLVGFGRGSLSLVSQLGPSMGNKFSYCLVSRTDSSKTSPLFIGNTASLEATTVGSTPLVQSSSTNHYYLSLEGISVGGQSLAIPTGTFDIQSDGSGGLIIDSGTTLTFLQQTAYDAVKEAMVSSINLPQADGQLDLCFNQQGSSNPGFPSMTFHFKGADYDVPKENYLFPDSTSDIVCLAMMPTNSNLGNMAIFGNVQQQNYQILYDNENNVLSFAPTACDTL
uniref:Peptidase A1 domain-containing protein n=1 Tax=Picea sitchensis TaxID=3332 RepID=C0PSK7_PICSI|nr:unknown [Picea sitchensis]